MYRFPFFENTLVGTSGTAESDPFCVEDIVGSQNSLCTAFWQTGLAPGFGSAGTGIFSLLYGMVKDGPYVGFVSGSAIWNVTNTAPHQSAAIALTLLLPWAKLRFVCGTSAPVMIKAELWVLQV